MFGLLRHGCFSQPPDGLSRFIPILRLQTRLLPPTSVRVALQRPLRRKTEAQLLSRVLMACFFTIFLTPLKNLPIRLIFLLIGTLRSQRSEQDLVSILVLLDWTISTTRPAEPEAGSP